MDVSKLLNEQMKREARKAITDYVKSEIHEVAYEEAKKIVAVWMKEHKEELRSAVNTEMEKRFKDSTTPADVMIQHFLSHGEYKTILNERSRLL